MLEHKYADSNLRFDNLKGKDRIKARKLQHACQEQGFSFFLANMEQTVTGWCEEECHHWCSDDYDSSEEDVDHHSIVDELKRSVKLKTVALPGGPVCARDVDFEIDNILQYEPFADDPDEEDCDAGEVTHHYRNSCILIMPEENQGELFFKSTVCSPAETKCLLDHLSKTLQEIKSETPNQNSNPSLQPCQTRLEKFCKYIITRNHHSYDKSLYEDVVSVALLLDQPSLFLMMVRSTTDNMSLSAYRKIGLALPFGVSEPLEWQKGAAIAARKATRVHEIWAALSEVADGIKASLDDASTPGKVNLDSVSAWMYSTITCNLSDPLTLVDRDTQTLVKITLRQKNPEQSLLSTILPYVKRNVTNKGVTLTFLGTLFECYKKNQIRKEVVWNLYRDIMNVLGPDLFKLDESVTFSKKPKYTPIYGNCRNSIPYIYGRNSISSSSGGGPSAPSLTSCLEPGEIAGLLGQCLSLGLKNEVQSILHEILNKWEYYPIAAFESIWIPFLRALVMVTPWPDQTLMEYRPFFQSIINSYIRRYLGEEPPTIVDRHPSRRVCVCGVCELVDRFLRDPEQQTGRFTYKKSIREHLEQEIGRYYEHTTDTTGSPHTLVIKKNKAEFKTKRAVANYKERCERTRRNLISIGIPALNKLLGTTGDELINFKSVRNKLIAAGGGIRVPLASIPQPANTPAPNRLYSLTGAEIDSMTNALHPAKNVLVSANPTNTIRRPDYILKMNKLCEMRRLKPKFGTHSRKDDNGPGNNYYGILSLMNTSGDVSMNIYPNQAEHFKTEMSLRQTLAQKACVWLKEKKDNFNASMAAITSN